MEKCPDYFTVPTPANEIDEEEKFVQSAEDTESYSDLVNED